VPRPFSTVLVPPARLHPRLLRFRRRKALPVEPTLMVVVLAPTLHAESAVESKKYLLKNHHMGVHDAPSAGTHTDIAPCIRLFLLRYLVALTSLTPRVVYSELKYQIFVRKWPPSFSSLSVPSLQSSFLPENGPLPKPARLCTGVTTCMRELKWRSSARFLGRRRLT
jgi:hypothetical protein